MCRFFSLEAPLFHPRLYFAESQTSPPTLPPQQIHIFVKIYISSPHSGVIYVSLMITPDCFRLDLAHPSCFVFSYNQLLVSSHPTSIFVFFFPINSFLYLKLLLTIGYPPPEFHPQLTIYISHMFFLSAYVLSFSTSVTQTCFFLFRGCG